MWHVCLGTTRQFFGIHTTRVVTLLDRPKSSIKAVYIPKFRCVNLHFFSILQYIAKRWDLNLQYISALKCNHGGENCEIYSSQMAKNTFKLSTMVGENFEI